jgi:hypothetical protein
MAQEKESIAMAPNSKLPEKNRPTKSVPMKAPPPETVKADAAEPIAIEPIEPIIIEAAAAPAAEPVPEVTISAVASIGGVDVKTLPLMTLDLLNENAAALFDFTAELGKVTSVADAIELQSRFASERYATFLRQSNEVAELTRKLALGVVSFRHSYGALAT